MSAIRAYGRIQWLSLRRYWQSLPFIMQLLFLCLSLGLIFLLYKMEVDIHNYKLSSAIVCGYVFLCLNFSFTKNQKLLLNNYSAPIHLILLVRNLLFSIPIFILQWKIGLICVPLAFFLAFLKPQKLSVQGGISRFKPVYFFYKGSYQWQSFYRQAGFYIHCLILFCIFMGVVHENPNLSLVSFLVLGVVPGVFSTLKMEALFFVKTYPNPGELIRKKMMEMICNISALQLPVGILLICYGLNAGHIAYAFFLTIVLSWISLATKYSRYPDELQTQFILFLVVLPITILCLIIGSWLLIVVLFIALIAGYLMRQNLKTVFSPSLDSSF